jgi:DNA-directed RNA polymerase specialized sigma24 family protein
LAFRNRPLRHVPAIPSVGNAFRLVGELPEAARMVVILPYQEDLDPLEISRILGMRITTVKSHLRRALALLRSKMVDEEARP